MRKIAQIFAAFLEKLNFMLSEFACRRSDSGAVQLCDAASAASVAALNGIKKLVEKLGDLEIAELSTVSTKI